MIIVHLRRRPRRGRRPVGFLPNGCHNPGRDAQLRDHIFNRLGVPKCPRCGAPLVARLRHTGPYFACQCLARAA